MCRLGDRDLLPTAKKILNLRSFVYMSTAYSHCVHREIKEEFYEPPITGEKLLTLLDSCSDEFLDKITPILIEDCPNTYVFSKAVAEDVVLKEGRGLPLAMVRPSIVSATAKEPVEGFIDNYYGVNGVALAAGIGLIHVLNGKSEGLADIVPAHYAINNAIAAAWSVRVEESENNGTMGDCRKPLIFYYISTQEKPLTWRDVMEYGESHFSKYPTKHILCFYFLIFTSNYYLYMVLKLLFHYIPAYIVDFLARLIGKRPLYVHGVYTNFKHRRKIFSLVDGYKKIDKFMGVIEYFTINQWKFSHYNTQALYRSMSASDKQRFFFDMHTFDWNDYFPVFGRGLRLYLLKDPMETLPEGKRWFRKLRAMYYIIKGGFWIALLWIGYSLMKCVLINV